MLSDSSPLDPGQKQVRVLTGDRVNDYFFHDAYHGTVTLRQTLELWFHEQDRPADGPIPISVFLTRQGDLDFTGNPDPAAAETGFDRLWRRREGLSRRYVPGQGLGTDSNSEETREASQRAVDNVSSKLDGQQGLLNIVQRLRVATERPTDGHTIGDLMVLVEDYATAYAGLEAHGQAGSAHDLQVEMDRLINATAHTNAGHLLIFFDRKSVLSSSLVPESDNVRHQEVPRTSPREIEGSLLRATRRNSLQVTAPSAVSEALSQEGMLTAALARAGKAVATTGHLSVASVTDLPTPDETALAAIDTDLADLVGLDEFKGLVQRLKALGRARRSELETTGVLPADPLHVVLTGNAGTGKTTAARVLAKLFHALGLLPNSVVTEAPAPSLVGEHVGATKTKTNAAIQDALGGVLFIDEAHQLGEGYGSEAIQALVPAAWDYRDRLVVILAGYHSRMHTLFTTDEGLSRRFPEGLRVNLPDYDLDALWEILQRKLRGQQWTLDPAAEQPMRAVLQTRMRRHDFGNAGGVENLVAEAVRAHHTAERPGRALTVEDLPQPVVRHPEDLAKAVALFEGLIGLREVRDRIELLQATIQIAVDRNQPPPAMGSYLFVGPPGTGKTTVARLFGHLLYGLGVAYKPDVVETTGAELKAAYLGQTAPRVRSIFAQARGGVLFLDEAYALTDTSGQDTYAREAIATLIAELTSPENLNTTVILAGYEDEMNEFMRSNPGLGRRFETIRFEPFGPDECLEVARRLTAAKGLTLPPDFEHLFQLEATRAGSSPHFGNAGWASGVIKRCEDQRIRRLYRAGQPVPETGELTVGDLRNALGLPDPVTAD